MHRADSRYCIREERATAPGLRFAQSYWALQQRELPIAHLLEQACREGYTYLEAGVSEERMPALRELLADLPLRFLAQGWARSSAEAQPFLNRAADLHAVAINMHLGHAYLTTGEAVQIIEDTSRRAKALGLTLWVETHRGRLTQDLFRFAEVVDSTPDLGLVLDVSHYIAAGETLGGDPTAFHRCLSGIVGRTAAIHGRISDGQNVQVRSSDPMAMRALTCAVWRDAMRSWLATAPENAVLLFEPELGPPPYAQRDAAGAEPFDRTAESSVLRQLAEQAWMEARESFATDIATAALPRKEQNA